MHQGSRGTGPRCARLDRRPRSRSAWGGCKPGSLNTRGYYVMIGELIHARFIGSDFLLQSTATSGDTASRVREPRAVLLRNWSRSDASGDSAVRLERPRDKNTQVSCEVGVPGARADT